MHDPRLDHLANTLIQHSTDPSRPDTRHHTN